MNKENKIELEVPTDWSDVTVNQFQQLQTLKIDEYESELLYMVSVISILAGVDENVIMGDNIENLTLLIGEMDFINKPLPNEIKEEIKIGKQKFGWKSSLNKISVGEMVSIETVIDLEELSYNSSLDVICAVLLRTFDKEGKLEDFDGDLFEERRKLFGELPITDVYGKVFFFSTGDNKSLKSTVDSLVQTTEKDLQKKRWSWKKR